MSKHPAKREQRALRKIENDAVAVVGKQDRDREWDRNRRAQWDLYRDRDRSYWQQNQRLSGEDQGRFDSYFQRWQNYRRTNNRDEVISMEKRMFDVYDHYGIPHDVPFEGAALMGCAITTALASAAHAISAINPDF